MDRCEGGPVNSLRSTPIRSRRLLCLAVIAFLITGCGADPGPPVPPDGSASDRKPEAGGVAGLVIDFDAAPAAGLPILDVLATVGGTSASTVSLGGGQINATPGVDGSPAARFPTNAESANGARAVLKLGTSGPQLTPGPGGFQFGVDLMYPAGSAGDTAGDDGDNLFQRGLFGDQGQFKIQVDHGRPACRIAGSERETLVKAGVTLVSDQWYRLLCQRAAGQITLFVAELGPTTVPLGWKAWSVPDRAGEFPSNPESVPVSIGGKLNPEGEIVREAPDQFNGVLDNVVFLSLER